MEFDLSTSPHQRFNPLTGEWVTVSPQRTRRPWKGQVEQTPRMGLPSYDPDCYLCPGNQRAGDTCNPNYQGVYVFTNDFASLLPQSPEMSFATHPLLQGRSERGTCRVMCFSPQHDLTLPEMSPQDLLRVVDAWAEQTAELGASYRWVQIFENKGALMGASNPHPHCQIWAESALPNEALKEDEHQLAYFRTHGTPLLVDYGQLEKDLGERLVVENEVWRVVVPFWAAWPYETLLLPTQKVQRFPDLTQPQRKGLVDILKRLLTRYDNLFQVPFPYSMGWHGAPFDNEDESHWQLHAHFYPPLLRSATIRKFMVGYELLGQIQRDLTPELAAEQLRALDDRNYRA